MFFDSHNNPVEEEEAKGRDDVVKRFYARYYNVFNIAEVEGIEPKIPDAKGQDLDPLEAGEALVEGMPDPPTIRRSGGEAFYEPPSDTVQVPPLKQFQDAPAFYAVLFHELIHATGPRQRLARPEVMEATKFGSLVYSLEELTAEIGATTLRNIAGIEHDSTLQIQRAISRTGCGYWEMISFSFFRQPVRQKPPSTTSLDSISSKVYPK